MTEIVAYKGFDKNFQCRGFQYEVGKTYVHEGPVRICKSGFHACENPIEVLKYYPFVTSRYAEIMQSGKIIQDKYGTKIASSVLNVVKELSFLELVERSIKLAFEKRRKNLVRKVRYKSHANNAGDYSIASSEGMKSIASVIGDYSIAIANDCASLASSSGSLSIAKTFRSRSIASSCGDLSVSVTTGHWSIAATNDADSTSITTGDNSLASSIGGGSRSISTGRDSASISSGPDGMVSGGNGCALFLVYRDSHTNEILHTWSGIVGKNGIKPDVFYTLSSDGTPIEVEG